ncbi:type 1 fimbrial protein [Erwinia persicina]|uniref:type 1 fimbrial protein n=1 Tax=Erwinia persicina TaxID=55211 RepID=UPI0013C33727|nr:type 1 fimbrial protein [Erwinia persicina]
MNVSKLIPFHIITIVTALFIASSNATSQASLTLQGEILPSSCDITMDSSGKVQLGKMNTPNFSSEKKASAYQKETSLLVLIARQPPYSAFALWTLQ